MRAITLGLLSVVILSDATGGSAKELSCSIESLKWMSGCWKIQTDHRQTIERWSAPAGGLMLGTSITIVQDKAVEWEFLRIEMTRSGGIVYTALPSGQKETPFQLTRLNESEAVFENPNHDFPKKLTYTLRSDGILHILVEGETNGKSGGFQMEMKKISCD